MFKFEDFLFVFHVLEQNRSNVNKDDLKISAKMEGVRAKKWMFLDSDGNNDEFKMSVEMK